MDGSGLDLPTQLRVPVERLRRRLDPATLPFETTADVEPIVGTVGQPRALEALEFALEVPTYGYNVYVAGRPGSGRESTVLRLVEQIAATRPTPPDWVYVHNFQDPERPIAISLPAGRGTQLARDMDEFLRAAQQAIPRAFESEEYDRRRRAIVERLGQERERLWEGVRQFAQQLGFAVELTPAGVISVPVIQGRPLSPEEYERLPEPVREELERRNQRIQDRVADALREVRRLEREVAERLRQLDREVALFAVGGLFEELRERYQDLPQVIQFLEQVREDIPEHLHDFFPPQLPGVPAPIAQLQALQQQEHLARYRVNVFVDNSQTRGAPVLFERNPSYYNLVGRIDYRATFGAMVTDFSQIRAGALHRANGGFLVLHALEVLSNPFAWEALKRALITRQIVIENLGQQYAVLPTATLRPDPIPLDVKVVLLGSPLMYFLLSAYDDDFRELFRVRADFAPDMDWTDEHVMGYAAFISRVVREQGLRHFDRGAVARVIEYGARQVEHQRKLSSQLLEIGNLVAEASYWAGKAGRDIVTAEDVETAIRKKRYRSDLIAERVRELIAECTLKILTRGERVGQINGLAVIELGDFTFGKPSRVTARVSLGRGNLISIEREIALSGPIHSKGFLILSNYLASAYAQDFPLAISASITFEQAYEEIEGDSASSTELYALLSTLSGLPIKQGIAVTGSVNQYGEVQAIGGVNEKIEGFFAVCKEQGLTGDQGVIIPAANVQHLMLDEEVVQAVREGRFHIWAVETIDQGIEILTGVPAGERQADGSYPDGTVHRRVLDRLRAYAERLRDFGRQGDREVERGGVQGADPGRGMDEGQDG